MQVIHNPPVPYASVFSRGFFPGSRLIVEGRVPHHGDRFDINLVVGRDMSQMARDNNSIALHFNPRMSSRAVVLNSRSGCRWEHEQWHHHVHQFQHGSHFSINIVVESSAYRIYVDGHHFCDFPHRMSCSEVGHLTINGAVELHKVEVFDGPSAPPYPGPYPGPYPSPYPRPPHNYPNPYPTPPPPSYPPYNPSKGDNKPYVPGTGHRGPTF